MLKKRVLLIKLSKSKDFTKITETGINHNHIFLLLNRIPHMDKSIKLIINYITPTTKRRYAMMKEAKTIIIQTYQIMDRIFHINIRQNPESFIQNLRNKVAH